ncbi:oxygen-independent coproporphyrinogen III oxidase [Lacimicrobium alkaliphilum]|uniref:Coproporphyrinogen-III oxidase n=1 Tax=Lacimicrobium alkaliphilum TaxID=1526571 RepID=A0ABQ1RM24_9ALTE|nr:oxygen-independent coproporphyrinogen III oxidase [Lacimicrobium alkaliphilum]GGD71530.1 coproporphyrinogen-III oxidase [Lacimicrobium alkaliphilum]
MSVLQGQLLNKYNLSGPRYTSYPTALQLGDIDPEVLVSKCREATAGSLSLYLHIPFCHSLCYYCGCNKVITRQVHKAEVYMGYLMREISEQSQAFTDKKVTQIHFGGGTPTYLSDEQFTRLMAHIRTAFRVSGKAEISVEVDPRQMALPRLQHLYELGFNRLSIGVQDFNPAVQQAVNRVQDESHIFALVTLARELGYASVSLDLIYGLPHQTPQSFAETIDKVLQIRPDRLSVFNYAHMPDKFAAQRRIDDSVLPDSAQRTAIFGTASELLTKQGYLCIGMDHFALRDDELAIAQEEGCLHRNFQGYTTQGECDLLGLGVSAISQINGLIVQNEKDLKTYYRAIDDAGSATAKGYELSDDDKVRAEVIKQLICHFRLSFQSIEQSFNIRFGDYFAEEMQRLKQMVADGLLDVSDKEIKVSQAGRALIRAICMQFDRYLPLSRQKAFSRII